MKKNYSKPQIMFDSFELSQSIAGACAGVQSDQAPYDCPVDFGGPLTLFAAMCDITPAPGDNVTTCLQTIRDFSGHNFKIQPPPNGRGCSQYLQHFCVSLRDARTV